ncbi:MAG: DUF401 family protein, partial [Promethearchaeota archaeon]
GLIIGTIIFALFADIPLIATFWTTLSNFSTILLIIIVLLIPLLGELYNETGFMKELISSINISKKASMILAPSLFGLLPVAGGALMSAPIVDQIEPDPEFPKGLKAGINVWYRHAFIMIYPLSSIMLVSSSIANISLYTAAAALFIPFIIIQVVGYFILLHPIHGVKENRNRDLKKAAHHLIPILIPPIFDLIGRNIFHLVHPEIFLIFGLIVSIATMMLFTQSKPKFLWESAKKMRIWRFAAMIFTIFWFLEVFQSSGMDVIISDLSLPFWIFILVGFFLGFATGRATLPLTLMVPTYLIQYNLNTMPLPDFSILYFIMFLGYIISPIHPCIAYSVDYLKTSYKQMLKYMIIPTTVCTIAGFGIYFLFALF